MTNNTEDSGGYPAQQQNPPGLTEPMRPEPDHGEDDSMAGAR